VAYAGRRREMPNLALLANSAINPSSLNHGHYLDPHIDRVRSRFLTGWTRLTLQNQGLGSSISLTSLSLFNDNGTVAVNVAQLGKIPTHSPARYDAHDYGGREGGYSEECRAKCRRMFQLTYENICANRCQAVICQHDSPSRNSNWTLKASISSKVSETRDIRGGLDLLGFLRNPWLFTTLAVGAHTDVSDGHHWGSQIRHNFISIS
jgi:hypothetical protein